MKPSTLATFLDWQRGFRAAESRLKTIREPVDQEQQERQQMLQLWQHWLTRTVGWHAKKLPGQPERQKMKICRLPLFSVSFATSYSWGHGVGTRCDCSSHCVRLGIAPPPCLFARYESVRLQSVHEVEGTISRAPFSDLRRAKLYHEPKDPGTQLLRRLRWYQKPSTMLAPSYSIWGGGYYIERRNENLNLNE